MDRHNRLRAKIKGTANIPRVSVFRSNRFTSAQLIDDASGRTVASATTHTLDEKTAPGNKTEQASKLGADLAERAKALGISSAVFDKGAYRYHGRVKAVAEAARRAGLAF